MRTHAVMRGNISPRPEMQIPPENAYTGLNIAKNFDEEFDRLSGNYELHNTSKLKSFTKKHENILGYIHELTPIIEKYFPNYGKFIEFCEDPEFSDLDFVMIYIKCWNYKKDKKNFGQI